jgi:hypothetical protein
MLLDRQQSFLEDYAYITLHKIHKYTKQGKPIMSRDQWSFFILSSYIKLSILPKLDTFLGNGAKNACWHFLTPLLKIELLLAMVPKMIW